MFNGEQEVVGPGTQIRDCPIYITLSNHRSQEPHRNCPPDCLTGEIDTTQCPGLAELNCPPPFGNDPVGAGSNTGEAGMNCPPHPGGEPGRNGSYDGDRPDDGDPNGKRH